MIENYRDHAANERTYLAWVRTGITVMVLGFIVEKFELFLVNLHGLLTSRSLDVVQEKGPELVSLALVTLGILVILAGAVRFFHIRKLLDTAGETRYPGAALTLVFTVALVAFGVYLLLYLGRIL